MQAGGKRCRRRPRWPSASPRQVPRVFTAVAIPVRDDGLVISTRQHRESITVRSRSFVVGVRARTAHQSQDRHGDDGEVLSNGWVPEQGPESDGHEGHPACTLPVLPHLVLLVLRRLSVRMGVRRELVEAVTNRHAVPEMVATPRSQPRTVVVSSSADCGWSLTVAGRAKPCRGRLPWPRRCPKLPCLSRQPPRRSRGQGCGRRVRPSPRRLSARVRRDAVQRTNTVASRSTTSPRRSGKIRVRAMLAAPRPGTFAYTPCGPRTIRPVSTSYLAPCQGHTRQPACRWTPRRGRRRGDDTCDSRRTGGRSRCLRRNGLHVAGTPLSSCSPRSSKVMAEPATSLAWPARAWSVLGTRPLCSAGVVQLSDGVFGSRHIA